MPKRSPQLEIRFTPIPLDPAFPIEASRLTDHTDQPITFLHVHQCLEVGYCHEGGGIFVIGDKVRAYRAGDVTFINHTEVHLARSAPGTTSRWTWINLDPLALVAPTGADAPLLDATPLAGPGFDNLFTPERVPAVGRVALRLIEEINGFAPGRSLAIRALVCELMTLAHRQTGGPDAAPSRPDYERLAPALAWMAHRYAEPANIGALARRCGLSEPHFRRLFLRTLGRTPLNYWHDLRLSMAASLLRSTAHSILEIGQLVGFESPSSLNRQFRARYAMSPRAWRG